MKRSRRELSINMVIHRAIFKSNQITLFLRPCFTFIPKTGVSFNCVRFNIISYYYNNIFSLIRFCVVLWRCLRCLDGNIFSIHGRRSNFSSVARKFVRNTSHIRHWTAVHCLFAFFGRLSHEQVLWWTMQGVMTLVSESLLAAQFGQSRAPFESAASLVTHRLMLRPGPYPSSRPLKTALFRLD